MAKEKGTDPNGAVDFEELAQERKSSAGKDKKITELQDQVAELEEKLAQAGEERTENTGKLGEMVAEARELSARLKEREAYLEAQARAINAAMEKGIPPVLAARDPEHWEETEKAIEELANNIAAGLRYPRTPQAAETRRKFGIKDGKEQPAGLSLAQLGKLSPRELRHVPEHLREKLLYGGTP